MGFYYDRIDEKWVPLDHDRKLTSRQRRELARHKALLICLLAELKTGNNSNSVITLYARMLARALVQSDQELMQALGQRVAQRTGMEESLPRDNPSDGELVA